MVGNIGLYYVCCELSKLGWNVLPTSRNAKGVDIVIYNHDTTLKRTIQVKALSKTNNVSCGNKNNLIADFLVICRDIFGERPEVFVMKMIDVKNALYKDCWLRHKIYEEEKNKDNWKIIEDGLEKKELGNIPAQQTS